MLKFPEKFFWGTATSSYQVEGGIKNDWSVCGKSRQGRNKYDAGVACDHYNRFEEDFDLAKSMNNNAHRFSIEWARIEPEEGKFDQNEIEHYRKVILALKQRGLEPFVTLYHWTLPIWFAEQGGWLNPKAPEYFARFTEKIVSEYKDLVKFWITLNEPNIYTLESFLQGAWPPFIKNYFKMNHALKQLTLAHKLAYEKIHQISNQAQVGITSCNAWHRGITKIADYKWNHQFFKRIKDHQDFVGINYYFTHSVLGFLKLLNIIKEKNKTDMGYLIVPEGIYHVLMDVKRYNKPVYIFENGLADAKDEKRAQFIVDHLKWTHRAIENSVDVKGYFHWSLLDNFEWDKGFAPRFGLIEIDYRAERDTNHAERGYNLKRIPRPSSKVYAEICKNNAINI
jgi:beta-glucosidase